MKAGVCRSADYLVRNEVSYERMAASLGVVEQAKEFNPSQGGCVSADVDIEQFTANTINFLNLIMLFHSKGVRVENVQMALHYSPPPHSEE